MRSGQTSLPRVVRERSGSEVEDIAAEQASAVDAFESEGLGLSFDGVSRMQENNEDDPTPLDSTPKRERAKKLAPANS